MPLPPDATSAPLTGAVTVAFDPAYERNHTIYAITSTVNKSIYRFIAGSSTKWESIDSTIASGSTLSQLVVSDDGVLYASNTKANGGMERSIHPTYSLEPAFEIASSGLEDGATLSGLWMHQNQLWAVDTTNLRLMSFIDSLNKPVILKSPPDSASGLGLATSSAIKIACAQ